MPATMVSFPAAPDSPCSGKMDAVQSAAEPGINDLLTTAGKPGLEAQKIAPSFALSRRRAQQERRVVGGESRDGSGQPGYRQIEPAPTQARDALALAEERRRRRASCQAHPSWVRQSDMAPQEGQARRDLVIGRL